MMRKYVSSGASERNPYDSKLIPTPSVTLLDPIQPVHIVKRPHSPSYRFSQFYSPNSPSNTLNSTTSSNSPLVSPYIHSMSKSIANRPFTPKSPGFTQSLSPYLDTTSTSRSITKKLKQKKGLDNSQNLNSNSTENFNNNRQEDTKEEGGIKEDNKGGHSLYIDTTFSKSSSSPILRPDSSASNYRPSTSSSSISKLKSSSLSRPSTSHSYRLIDVNNRTPPPNKADDYFVDYNIVKKNNNFFLNKSLKLTNNFKPDISNTSESKAHLLASPDCSKNGLKMLNIKNNIKKSETDLQIILNRIEFLKNEKEKSKKKFHEIEERIEEIKTYFFIYHYLYIFYILLIYFKKFFYRVRENTKQEKEYIKQVEQQREEQITKLLESNKEIKKTNIEKIIKKQDEILQNKVNIVTSVKEEIKNQYLNTEKEKFTDEAQRKIKAESERKKYLENIVIREEERIKREEVYHQQYMKRISEEEKKFKEIEMKIKKYEEIEKALTKELESELIKQDKKFEDLQMIIDEKKT